MSSDSVQAVAENPSRMALQVAISEIGPAASVRRVTVAEADIAAIRKMLLDDLAVKGSGPGLSSWSKCRKARCWKSGSRTEIAGDIKQKVLLASLEQIVRRIQIEPICEPKIDVGVFGYSGHWRLPVTSLKSKFDLNSNCLTMLESLIKSDLLANRLTKSSRPIKEQFLMSHAERVTSDEPAAAGIMCCAT
jgi:hypothetical protein